MRTARYINHREKEGVGTSRNQTIERKRLWVLVVIKP